MDRRPFVGLVRELIGAMGQELEAARPITEGFALLTQDRYLYVFLFDPTQGSPEAVRIWLSEAHLPAGRLVVFSLQSLPTWWTEELERGRATVVAGERFVTLVDRLGIDSPLVPRPESSHRGSPRFLPSAAELEAVMVRAESWTEAGVPPLAARFFQEAVRMKPEFVPGWLGLGSAFQSLARWEEAEQAWHRALSLEPGNRIARLGIASVHGARGEGEEEILTLRSLLESFPEDWSVRASLIAALAAQPAWMEANDEIERALKKTPRDPQLLFLHSIALEKIGESAPAREEVATARRLGLTPEREGALRRTLGGADDLPKASGDGATETDRAGRLGGEDQPQT